MEHALPPCPDCGLPHANVGQQLSAPRVYRRDGRCPLCQGFKPRGLRWCRTCRNTYERAHRKPYSAFTPEQRAKVIARAYLRVYLRRGVVKRRSCEFPNCCSRKRAQAHHHDYSKPLEVQWLCKKHHGWVHAALRFAQEIGQQGQVA